IMGNQISNNGDHGISSVSSSQNLIQGNYSYSNGDNNTNGCGFYIDGASHDNLIVGNIGHTNDGYGAQIIAGAQRNSLIGNSFINNEDGAISDAGTATINEHNQN
ncbi:MAG: right-handed parallel beta-helix repeat-containing protein, partial [Candidatus Riflebacteria bacterium]|nr:right-handed parallel beta-helix repeat-containing protein [Candidatus Riflebacteria bacterium]